MKNTIKILKNFKSDCVNLKGKDKILTLTSYFEEKFSYSKKLQGKIQLVKEFDNYITNQRIDVNTNYSKLLLNLESIKDNKFLIEDKDVKLVITSKNRELKQDYMGDIIEYNNSFEIKNSLTFKKEELISKIDRIKDAIAPCDEVREVLRTLCFYPEENNYNIITTNGRMLNLEKIGVVNECKEKELQEFNLYWLLLEKFIKSIKDFKSEYINMSIGSQEVKITCYDKENKIYFSMTFDLCLNKFPNFKQIIPSYFNYEYDIDSSFVGLIKEHDNYLKKLIKIDNANEGLEGYFTRLVLHEKDILVRTGSTVDQITDMLPLTCNKFAGQILTGINPGYFLKGLKQLKTGKLQFKENTAEPIAIRDNTFLSVIMPVRIK